VLTQRGLPGLSFFLTGLMNSRWPRDLTSVCEVPPDMRVVLGFSASATAVTGVPHKRWLQSEDRCIFRPSGSSLLLPAV
jgi:hypothetical protein